MLKYGDNPWPYIAPLIVTGTLVHLGAVAEGVDILCEMDARYCEIRREHEHALREWRELRHDVSHHMDRIFRDKKGRPAIAPPFDTISVAIASMRPDNEIRIQTGSNAPVSLNSAISELKTIVDQVRVLVNSSCI